MPAASKQDIREAITTLRELWREGVEAQIDASHLGQADIKHDQRVMLFAKITRRNHALRTAITQLELELVKP